MIDLARRLPLYREAWEPRPPRALDDAPLVAPWLWRRHVHRAPGRSLAAAPVLWALHEVPGDDPVWVPFGAADLRREALRAQRVFRDAGVRRGDVVLVVAPPGPGTANLTPYLLSGLESLVPADARIGCEVIALSLLTVSFKAELTIFPHDQTPAVLVASAADALGLADLAASAGAATLRCRLALVHGPAPSATPFASDQVDLLYLPGALAPFGGSPGEPGVWLGPDAVRAEIVPDDEWGRAVAAPARAPRAVAPAPGLSGELVVTIPNEALPVIRFRTQERVRVAAVDRARGVRVERVAGFRAGRGTDRAVAAPR